MKARGRAGRTIQLKVKYSDFVSITRQVSLPRPVSLGKVIAEEAIALLQDKTEYGARPIRLIGVGVAELSAGGQEGQRSLFPAE